MGIIHLLYRERAKLKRVLASKYNNYRVDTERRLAMVEKDIAAIKSSATPSPEVEK